MTSTAVAAPSARGRVRGMRILVGVLVVVVFGAAATLFGWNVSGWFKHVWNTITTISVGYLIAAVALITLQTTATAYAWYSILRFAYSGSNVRWREILACYAAAVALNNVLPANLGSLAMLVMFATIIAGATFAGIVAGYVVQKIFYTLIGAATYLYLFLSVGGSFSLQFGFVREHPAAVIVLVAGTAALFFLLARIFKVRVARWWGQAKHGGEILVHPRDYLGRVFVPEVVSWLAMVGIIAVFLAAYSIPVSFHTLMRVVGGNSIANMTSVTPGGAGVQQGFNVLSLKGVTSSANATAYSVAQQLVTTVWDILFAILLLIRAFGWSEGRALVEQSYTEARTKSAEQSAARRARREARREARHGGASEDAGP